MFCNSKYIRFSLAIIGLAGAMLKSDLFYLN